MVTRVGFISEEVEIKIGSIFCARNEMYTNLKQNVDKIERKLFLHMVNNLVFVVCAKFHGDYMNG